MLRSTLRLAVVVAALSAVPSHLFASPVVIDFETVTEGDAITNRALSGEAGSSPNELVQLAFGDISHVTITGKAAGGSFVLDNLIYTPAQAVPEPATASLLLLGVAVLTRVRRRV